MNYIRRRIAKPSELKLLYSKVRGVLVKMGAAQLDSKTLVDEALREDWEYWLIYAEGMRDYSEEWRSTVMTLVNWGYMVMLPLGPNNYLVGIPLTDILQPQTVTSTHILLPDLMQMLQLAPEHFFQLLGLLGSVKPTGAANSFTLDASKGDIYNPIIGQFFLPVQTSYRLNPTFVTKKKWVSYKALRRIADIEPTYPNQLAAVQMLITATSPETTVLCVDAALTYELELEATADENYFFPPNWNK